MSAAINHEPGNDYNRDFVPVANLEEAAIVVIQGAVWRQKPDVYHQGLKYFLHDLHAILTQK